MKRREKFYSFQGNSPIILRKTLRFKEIPQVFKGRNANDRNGAILEYYLIIPDVYVASNMTNICQQRYKRLVLLNDKKTAEEMEKWSQCLITNHNDKEGST